MNWNEYDHPRGRDGKFAKKPGDGLAPEIEDEPEIKVIYRGKDYAYPNLIVAPGVDDSEIYEPGTMALKPRFQKIADSITTPGEIYVSGARDDAIDEETRAEKEMLNLIQRKRKLGQSWGLIESDYEVQKAMSTYAKSFGRVRMLEARRWQARIDGYWSDPDEKLAMDHAATRMMDIFNTIKNQGVVQSYMGSRTVR